ncbi:TPA: hypothetical protein ACH3X2_008360 [Trebouxia sp. C0005]
MRDKVKGWEHQPSRSGEQTPVPIELVAGQGRAGQGRAGHQASRFRGINTI